MQTRAAAKAAAAKRRRDDGSDEEAETCTICFGTVDDSEPALPCGHRFHATCIEAWLDQKPRCPCCRKIVREPCIVTIRGLDVPTPWCKKDTVLSVIVKALNIFCFEQYPMFSFRFPCPAEYHSTTFSDELRVRARLAECVIELTENCPIVNLFGPREAFARIEVMRDPRHPKTIPGSEFAFARLLLPKPERDAAMPPTIDDYYRRRAGTPGSDWLEEAEAAHNSGQCRWSRRRNVLELEAELTMIAPDDEDSLADDELWAPLRRRHVLLRQALLAYERGHAGHKQLFDEASEGPLEGPAGKSPVGLPACRAHEDAEIEREARADLPIHLYACPTTLEYEGAGFFVTNLFFECGILERPSDREARHSMSLLREVSQNAIAKSQGTQALTSLRHEITRKWDDFKQHIEQPLMIIALYPAGGLLMVLNEEAPLARGKLPRLSEDERFIEVPGVNMEFDEDMPSMSETEEHNTEAGECAAMGALLGATSASPRELVHKFFQTKCEEHQTGFTIAEAAAALASRGVSEAQVRNLVHHLVSESLLYSTIDDDHFKATHTHTLVRL